MRALPPNSIRIGTARQQLSHPIEITMPDCFYQQRRWPSPGVRRVHLVVVYHETTTQPSREYYNRPLDPCF